jgi:nucleotide-binding universal stress UspA family protein
MTCHDVYDAHLPTRPRVVVGVDGSAASHAAIRWATEHAHVAGAVIVAVYVQEPVMPLDFTGAAFAAVAQLDTGELQRQGREVVSRIVRDIPMSSADEVQQVVIQGSNPGQALVRAARDASLLVVGSHPHRGLGLLLGSTGASCVRHAACPVVVVPETWRASSGTHASTHQEAWA